MKQVQKEMIWKINYWWIFTFFFDIRELKEYVLINLEILNQSDEDFLKMSSWEKVLKPRETETISVYDG